MRIFLVGFMGCGKTTFGKKLAKRLGFDFVDLDHEIEKKAGMTVGQYFDNLGEGKFRETERKMLQEFKYPDNCVISTGGGVPCFFDNMEWMNENGKTVYIHMDPGALAKRLENGKAQRPLLKGLDNAGLIRFIENKLAEREKFYNKARIIINGVSLTPDKLIPLLGANN